MLHPDHPMRRFLSVFTFGTIKVNLEAIHTLLGPKHSIHRASPFEDLESLSKAVPKELPDLMHEHMPFINETAWDALPELVKHSPYFADGKLLFNALRKLMDNFAKLYWDDFCDSRGHLKDPELIEFRNDVLTHNLVAHYQGIRDEDRGCVGLMQRLLACMWTVTGYHRHVGSVGDYYVDPDLASFSWKEGEAYPRPRQHFIVSIIAAFTSTVQPKLNQDFTHIFHGIQKEDDAISVWEGFRRDLDEVQLQIERRNQQREFKNFHSDPSLVECSVGV